MLYKFFSNILFVSFIFLALIGCETSPARADFKSSKIFSDAKSMERKGVAYGNYLQENWTSSSFVVLQSSKIDINIQRVELMLRTLPMVMGKVSCEPSELLEVRLLKYKDTQKEIWKARVCGEISDMETVVTIDDKSVANGEKSE